MIFLTLEHVIELHDAILLSHGGMPGIRDIGLLISSIEMPKAMMFGEYLHESVFDKAAAYLFHIVCNHAFFDGNKRTGAVSALTFLGLNGCDESAYNQDAFEDLVCFVAQGRAGKTEISKFLRNN